LVSWP